MAQEEYAQEGIDWSYIEFIDNQDCLDLLEGSTSNPSLAVFPLIDEACRLPRATYEVSLSFKQHTLPWILQRAKVRWFLSCMWSVSLLTGLLPWLDYYRSRDPR